MFAKVLAALDGTERGEDALALAHELVEPGGEVIACCVHRFRGVAARIDPTGPDLDAQAAQSIVEGACSETHGVTVRPLATEGESVAAVLERTAVQEQAELIALGSSHRGRLGEIFPGSVTLEVLRSARCSLAVAPIGYHEGARPVSFARVAVGYDIGEPVPAALSAAAQLCQSTGAALRVIGVADDSADVSPATTPYGEAREDRLVLARKAVDAALATIPAGVSASGEVLDGEPAELLLKAGEQLDLLVLGAHRRSWLDRLLMGSVAEQVVRRPSCPVLVVATNS